MKKARSGGPSPVSRVSVTTNDPYDLERFALAQDARETHASAVAELRAGRKRGHWMWFVFPQIAGLGMSSMSRRYAISSLEEARQYLAHPILGSGSESARAFSSSWRGRRLRRSSARSTR